MTPSRVEQREMDRQEPTTPVCGECWFRMSHDLPIAPFQTCGNGHELQWWDESIGRFRDFDDDGTKDA